MKKTIILLLFLCLLPAMAEPIFYFVSRFSSGGLYTLNNTTKVVSKITSGQDFMTISQYGSDKLLVSSYGTRQLFIFNLDGSTARSISLSYYPLGAIEKKDGSGNIYYADYFGSAARLYDVTTNSDSLLHDVTNSRSYGIEQRSNGDLYLTEGDIKKAATNTSIYSGIGSPYWVSMDTSDNFYACYNQSTINKIDANNAVTTWWSDSNITLYNFNYDAVTNAFYGIGSSSGQYNVYKFTTAGVASVYISNISGFYTGGDWHDLIIYNTDVPTIPEPGTMLLLLCSIGIFFFKRKAIL